MIATWIGLPLELRMTLIALIGLIGGALCNFVIYTCAYLDPRPISPWGRTPSEAEKRRWSDRLPVVGWIGLRRESKIHGPGFWIRPMLIEIGLPIGLMLLYRFEAVDWGLIRTGAQLPALLASYEMQANVTFFAHVLLIILLVPATFIDIDEQTIPDVITVPGTIIAVLFSTLTISVFMPTVLPVGGGPVAEIRPTTFDSPWFVGANPWFERRGFITALAIWGGWCFALADRRWSGVILRRRGLGRAIRHFANGLFHYPTWKLLAAIWLIGSLGITVVWTSVPACWLGLFTSLVGLAVGGGIIWSIRIVATLALNKEAMGFGDVTLMAMIGALIGWQAAVIGFFLSPFAAIMIVVARYIITRDTYTPFGPYLSVGTLLAISFWVRLYDGWLAPNLNLMGPILLWLCLTMLGLMAVMLFVWRLIKSVLS